MILTPECSFFTLVWLKKRINTVRRIHFVLLALYMSNLFSYKHGFATLLATLLVCLATVIFIIFEQITQISGLQETLHTLCTHHLVSLSKQAVTRGYFQVWLPYTMTRLSNFKYQISVFRLFR